MATTASVPAGYATDTTNTAASAATSNFEFGIIGVFKDSSSNVFLITSEDIQPSDKRDVTPDQLGRTIHERIIERTYTLKLTVIGPTMPIITDNILEYPVGGPKWDCELPSTSGQPGQKKQWTITGHRSTMWPLNNKPDMA